MHSRDVKRGHWASGALESTIGCITTIIEELVLFYGKVIMDFRGNQLSVYVYPHDLWYCNLGNWLEKDHFQTSKMCLLHPSPAKIAF